MYINVHAPESTLLVPLGYLLVWVRFISLVLASQLGLELTDDHTEISNGEQ
jgi:hypothetical protein